MSKRCRTTCAARCRTSSGTRRSWVSKTGRSVTPPKPSTLAKLLASRGHAQVRTARSTERFLYSHKKAQKAQNKMIFFLSLLCLFVAKCLGTQSVGLHLKHSLPTFLCAAH